MLMLVSCQSQGPRRKEHNKIGENRTSNRGHRIGSDKIRKGRDRSVRVSSVRLELVSGLIVWARQVVSVRVRWVQVSSVVPSRVLFRGFIWGYAQSFVPRVQFGILSGFLFRAFAFSFVLDFVQYFVRVSVCDFVWVMSETLV